VSDAALDAATGIILEDELEEPEYEALFLPWTDAVEKIRIQKSSRRSKAAPKPKTRRGVAGDGGDDEETEGEFGPNSDSVADFLNRLWLLSPDQVTRLVSGWREAPQEQLEQAHEALHELVEVDPSGAIRSAAPQEKISPWLNGGRLQETASFMGQTGQSATRQMAGPASRTRSRRWWWATCSSRKTRRALRAVVQSRGRANRCRRQPKMGRAAVLTAVAD